MAFQPKKRKISIAVGILLGATLIVSVFIWNKYASTTKIALVNFQNYTVSNIVLSNTDKFISFEEVSLDELNRLKNYDFILGNGMGLKLDEEQYQQIKNITAQKPVFFKSVTNPENDFNSLTAEQNEKITAYFESGNKENYQNFARYVRKEIQEKKLFVTAPDKPKKAIEDVFFHIGSEAVFDNKDDYESYLKKNLLFIENAPKIAMIAGIHDPFGGNSAHLDSIIAAFQKSGVNIYPIASFSKRLQLLEEINPDAVIYFPHGRLEMQTPERVTNWLESKNIPLFTPLSVTELKKDWEESPFGLVGGFMGQVIVMPELDGALAPYVVISMNKTKKGLYVYETMPDRLRKFTEIVHNHIALKNKENKDKKIAIYFFKGQGNHTLNAQGMEAAPSLYNTLKRFKKEGYNLDGLPETYEEFEEIIARCGKVISPNAEGSFKEFLTTGNPTLIPSEKYDGWLKETLSDENYKSVIEKYGNAPGTLMAVEEENNDFLAVSMIKFGNIALLPQQLAAFGEDDFKVLHGVQEPPTHAYIGSYLWAQKEFKADALLHFGTHGSLEFTPYKQVALDNNDWGDILIGTIPHFYFYSIGNVGESMMAKRRSYAALVSYLTSAFVESDMRDYFKEIQDKILQYHKIEEEKGKTKISFEIKKKAIEMGLHRSLRLDSNLTVPYTSDEIYKLDNFAEEVATEKINGEFYTAGEAYSPEKIQSTVMAMSIDPLAYSLAYLDKLDGKITDEQMKKRVFFTEHYLTPSKIIIENILTGKKVDTLFICETAAISKAELEKAMEIMAPKKVFSPVVQKNIAPEKKKMKKEKSDEIPSSGATKKEDDKKETPEKTILKQENKPDFSKEEKERAYAILEIKNTLTNVLKYQKALQESPELELNALINGLSGGYIAPSSGGDAVANPQAVPTGKNLYAINAEATPSEIAWNRGVALAQKTIQDYLTKNGEYPRKIAYTFWSSEFVETEGVSIAQALYLLGVEPVRDPFGRVADVRLIPSEELNRPRIDIVVQTSGQFRDLAASRLFLLTKAIELAANAPEDKFDNLVKLGTLDMEKQLVEKGIPPKTAREMANNRIFGGVQGRYDTGIQELIKAGDKWETQKEIADQYMLNMGAVYGQKEDWAKYQEGMFRAALNNADIIVQPRQNNTWGALSLDHVFEFMGGMNAAIKEVTGKDPEAYMADYRNRNNMRMQELKESIGVEARATILNPKFIQEMMKGKASSAGQITEIVTNTFGWEATRPEVIDNELWDEIYDTYVLDIHQLNVKDFFKNENPAGLQEITAVLLESTRKGMWKATPEQIDEMTKLHIDLVKEFGAESSGFAGENKKLHQYIAQLALPENAQQYEEQIEKMETGNSEIQNEKSGKILKQEQFNSPVSKEKTELNGILIASILIAFFIGIMFFFQKKRKSK